MRIPWTAPPGERRIVRYGCRAGFPSSLLAYLVSAALAEAMSIKPSLAALAFAQCGTSEVMLAETNWFAVAGVNEAAGAGSKALEILPQVAPVSVQLFVTRWINTGVLFAGFTQKYTLAE